MVVEQLVHKSDIVVVPCGSVAVSDVASSLFSCTYSTFTIKGKMDEFERILVGATRKHTLNGQESHS